MKPYQKTCSAACRKETCIPLSKKGIITLLQIYSLHNKIACYELKCSHWWNIYKNPLQDLLSSKNALISTNESTRFTTVHVPDLYTYKFQLKTIYVWEVEHILHLRRSWEGILIEKVHLVCVEMVLRRLSDEGDLRRIWEGILIEKVHLVCIEMVLRRFSFWEGLEKHGTITE